MQQESKLWTIVWYVFAFCIAFWIPIYFLWDTIMDLFHDITSINQTGFRRLLEMEHWVLFYTFACVILTYISYKAFLILLACVSSILLLASAIGGKYNNIWIILFQFTQFLLLFVSYTLPVLSYLVIWNNLYPDFSFTFTWMLNYIGFFEFYMIFVVIFEAFILDVWIISFFTRVWMYGYLLYMFW